MAARIPLVKLGTATTGPASNGFSASIPIRLADPPFLFVVTGTWTGTARVQHSVDSPSVADADATWVTILTFVANDQQTWGDPLYRVRASTASVATGSANVIMLENIRRTKDNDGA